MLVRLMAPLVVAALLSAAPATAVASPAQPVLAGSVSNSTTLSTTVAVAVSGHYAYTTAYQSGQLTAVDISNPAAPVVTGSTAVSNSLYGGSGVNIAGGYAYVVSKNRNASASSNDDGTGNSLTIVDIHTNPAVPATVGVIHDPANLFGAYGVAIASSGGHTYAYVAAQGLLQGQPTGPDTSTGSFSIIDVTNPAAPFIVPAGGGLPGGHLDNGALPGAWAGSNALEHATSVFVSGHYAYVTAFYSNRLTVIDIANPADPTIVSSVQDNVYLAVPTDVAVRGNYAYVSGQTTNPAHSNLTVVDVSNPAGPQIVAGVIGQTSMFGGYRLRLSANGNFAYVAANSTSAEAVDAVDISNPAAPRLAGFVGDTSTTSPFAHLTGLDVDPSGQYVIGSSPFKNTESNPVTPPFSTTTGTITDVALDPQPIAVTIAPASKPASPTLQRTADFTFSTSDAIASVQCKLDGAPYSFCTSPADQQYGSGALSVGPHTFTVQATDAAGATATDSYTWTVDATPPAITITTPPNGATYTQNQAVGASYSCTAGAGAVVNSCSGPVANGAAIDTRTTGSHSFSVTVTQSDGQSMTITHAYTVSSGGGGQGGGGSAPAFSSVGETNRSFALRKTQSRKKHTPPVGTTFEFRLNESASVTLTFTNVAPGRKVKGKCVKPTSKNKHARSCQLLTPQGSITLQARQGANRVTFKGRVGRRTLKNGTYTLVIKAVAGGRTSSSKKLTFTIVSS